MPVWTSATVAAVLDRDDEYDAADDLAKSIALGFAVIRERMKNGGPGWEPTMTGKVRFNRDNKFDLQLDQGLIAERRLADIFEYRLIEKIELKTETWQWEQTGNICIEYRQRGQPSGIAVTEADYWVHELRRDGKTLCYLMFPLDRLKDLARRAYEQGHYHEGGGDGGQFCNVLIPLSDILK